MKKDTFLRKGSQKITPFACLQKGQRSIVDPNVGLEYVLTLVT